MSTTNFETHRKAVESISAKMKYYHDRKEMFRISHGSTNSTRLVGKGRKIVDTSALSNVLAVNEATKTCLVEPNVPMDRLVEATLRHGLIPPVVMEFPGITVGGGYAGTSGESSSFRHGFFNRTINQIEMILADGEVVNCSSTERRDLLEGAAGAVGSLGVTTLVELQLHEAKKYVETTYHSVTSISEAIEKTKQLTADQQIDYVDGILFSPQEGAIISGRLTNDPPASCQKRSFSRPSDPWFYLHVQEILGRSSGKPVTEAVALPEYLFRYDRGGFWVGASAFKYFYFPFTRLTRRFLDDFLHTRMMYTALHASGQSHRYIVQDLALPFSTAERFIEYTTENFDIWPLWLCPLLQSEPPTFHPNLGNGTGNNDPKTHDCVNQQMLNIGLWGCSPSHASTPAKYTSLNRDLERKLKELGGMKWLYAQTFYTPSEFWSVYSKSTKQWYLDLRKKYRAGGLASVYEKVGPIDKGLRSGTDATNQTTTNRWKYILLNVWPLGGLWGLWKAIRSGSYKEARAAAWRHIEIPIGPGKSIGE